MGEIEVTPLPDQPSGPSTAGAIRLFVLTTATLHGRALGQVLNGARRLRVVGTGQALGPALAPLRKLRPDVVVFDLNIPNSAVALGDLPDAVRDIRIVAVTSSFTGPSERLSCVKARVAGYVSTEDHPDDLVATIEGVARGEVRCSPRTAAVLLEEVAALAPGRVAAPLGSGLTAREVQVTGLIGCGLTNKEIARRLSIALPTVKNHVHSILRKLRVSRRTDVIANLGSRGQQQTLRAAATSKGPGRTTPAS